MREAIENVGRKRSPAELAALLSRATVRAPNAGDGMEEAIAEAGSVAELARMIGISKQAVAKWHRLGQIPPARVLRCRARYAAWRARGASPRFVSAGGGMTVRCVAVAALMLPCLAVPSAAGRPGPPPMVPDPGQRLDRPANRQPGALA